MRYLRTNTATRVSVGPFLDKTDGVTPETSLTVTSCKLTLTVDDGGVPTLVLDTNPTASGGSNDMVHISGDDAGMYDLELAAANVNYLGRAKLILTDAATHCPVFEDFMIFPAVIYDAMVLGTDLFDVSMTQILGTAVSTPATAGILDINLKNIANATVSTSTAQLGVNAVNLGGTAQTGRDIGASVLLSSGTGTGQLDFTSGVVKANWVQILGTAITGTAAQLAASITKFFNVATPTGTVNSLPDAVPGTSSGLVIKSDVATAAQLEDQVLDALLTDHTVSGSVGQRIARVPNAAAGASGGLPTVDGSNFVAGIQASGIVEASFAADTSKYQAKVWLIDANGASTDRYIVIFFKNGEPVTSGITSPTIWVYTTGAVDLVGTTGSPTTLTQIGSTGTYKLDEGSNRIVNGTAYVARVRATIDSSTRTWLQPIGRDS